MHRGAKSPSHVSGRRFTRALVVRNSPTYLDAADEISTLFSYAHTLAQQPTSSLRLRVLKTLSKVAPRLGRHARRTKATENACFPSGRSYASMR